MRTFSGGIFGNIPMTMCCWIRRKLSDCVCQGADFRGGNPLANSSVGTLFRLLELCESIRHRARTNYRRVVPRKRRGQRADGYEQVRSDAGSTKFAACSIALSSAAARLAGDGRAVRERVAGGYWQRQGQRPACSIRPANFGSRGSGARARAAEFFFRCGGGRGYLPQGIEERGAADSSGEPGGPAQRD